VAKLQWRQQYDDEIQHFDLSHPVNAPEWSYCDQGDIIFDIDIELPKSIENYITEEEVKKEVEKGQTSVAGEYNSSDSHLKIDD